MWSLVQDLVHKDTNGLGHPGKARRLVFLLDRREGRFILDRLEVETGQGQFSSHTAIKGQSREDKQVFCLAGRISLVSGMFLELTHSRHPATEHRPAAVRILFLVLARPSLGCRVHVRNKPIDGRYVSLMVTIPSK